LSSSESFPPLTTHAISVESPKYAYLHIAISGGVLVDLDRRSVSKTSIRVCVTIANWRYSGAAADEPARKGSKDCSCGDGFVVRTSSSHSSGARYRETAPHISPI
jgi:hypothetical protein